MRRITEITRYTRKTNDYKRQSAYSIHLRAMQPTITSWMNKQNAIAMTKQTAPSRQIHHPTQTGMQNIQKWHDTWKTVRRQREKTTTNADKKEMQKNAKTPWIIRHKNKHTQKLQEYKNKSTTT